MKTTAVSTRLPEDLALRLDEVCDAMGFKKSRLIEIALREKLEDLLDAQDLNEAVSEETGFTGLDEARASLLGGD